MEADSGIYLSVFRPLAKRNAWTESCIMIPPGVVLFALKPLEIDNLCPRASLSSWGQGGGLTLSCEPVGYCKPLE